MFGRRHVKTRRDLVRAEFGESMDLFRQAAAHAAGGLGATVGPRNVRTRRRTRPGRRADSSKPAAGRVGERGVPAAGTRRSRRSRRWPRRRGRARRRAMKLDAKRQAQERQERQGDEGDGAAHDDRERDRASHTGLYALLATGAAVGAAGALVARRRTRAKWAEYEPASLRSDASSFMDAGATSKSFGDRTSGDRHGRRPRAARSRKAATWTKDSRSRRSTRSGSKIHEATDDSRRTTCRTWTAPTRSTRAPATWPTRPRRSTTRRRTSGGTRDEHERRRSARRRPDRRRGRRPDPVCQERPHVAVPSAGARPIGGSPRPRHGRLEPAGLAELPVQHDRRQQADDDHQPGSRTSSAAPACT